LLNLFIYLLFYIHLSACLQFYIISIDKTWQPSMQRFATPEEFYSSDKFTQYLVSLNLATLLLTGNDVLPESNAHIMSTCLLSISGALYIANIVGTVTVVVSALNRK